MSFMQQSEAKENQQLQQTQQAQQMWQLQYQQAQQYNNNQQQQQTSLNNYTNYNYQQQTQLNNNNNNSMVSPSNSSTNTSTFNNNNNQSMTTYQAVPTVQYAASPYFNPFALTNTNNYVNINNTMGVRPQQSASYNYPSQVYTQSQIEQAAAANTQIPMSYPYPHNMNMAQVPCTCDECRRVIEGFNNNYAANINMQQAQGQTQDQAKIDNNIMNTNSYYTDNAFNAVDPEFGDFVQEDLYIGNHDDGNQYMQQQQYNDKQVIDLTPNGNTNAIAINNNVNNNGNGSGNGINGNNQEYNYDFM